MNTYLVVEERRGRHSCRRWGGHGLVVRGIRGCRRWRWTRSVIGGGKTVLKGGLDAVVGVY